MRKLSYRKDERLTIVICIYTIIYIEVVLTKFAIVRLMPFCPGLNTLSAHMLEAYVDFVFAIMAASAAISVARFWIFSTKSEFPSTSYESSDIANHSRIPTSSD